jgi:hypothetical protein
MSIASDGVNDLMPILKGPALQGYRGRSLADLFAFDGR